MNISVETLFLHLFASSFPMEDVFPCHILNDESQGEALCAICFETRPFMILPCACKLAYCATCWNRAMAQSVKVRGQAQCPSCRMALCIDLDPDTGNISFSRQDSGANQNEWQSRLSSAAKFVQIRLLKKYGSIVRNPSTAASEWATSPWTATTAKSPDQSAIDPMSGLPRHMLNKPLCVCGGSLDHVTNRNRILRLQEEFEADSRHKASYVITCDLCDTDVPPTSSLWTCEDGCRSVLHPAAHDICEPCFSKYVGFAPRWSISRAGYKALAKLNFLFPRP